MPSSIYCLRSPQYLTFALAVTSSAAIAAPETKIETIEVVGERLLSYTTTEIDSATKFDLSIQETPQSVSVITRAQMDDFALNSINSVLLNTNGVFVQQVETDRTYYTARGFDIKNFQIDGLGLPLAYGNIDGDVDTGIYERVEVVRGANGLMTGAGNPSATVNLVRKRPTKELRASTTSTAGEWDHMRIEADVSGAISPAVRGRLVAAKQNGDSKSYLDRYELQKIVLYGVAEADLSESTLLSAGHSTQTSDASGNLWGALPLYYTDGSPTNYDVSTSTAADWTYWDIKEQRTFVELQQQLGQGWSLRAAYQYVKVDEDSELFYIWGTPNRETEVGLKGYASEYDLDEEHQLFDLYATGPFRLGELEHQLVLGASWATLFYNDRSLYDDTTGAGFPTIPSLLDWQGDSPRPVFRLRAPVSKLAVNGSDVDDLQKSVYLGSRLSLTEQAKLMLGARWDDWKSEGFSYGGDEEREEREVTPYFGLTYTFADNYTAYISYTETFAAQAERGINEVRLAPLTGESYEIGLKAALMNNKLNATAAIFKVRQNNLPVVANPQANPDDQYNIGVDAESRGVELELAGELLPGLQTSFGYTNLRLDSPLQNGLVEDYTPEQMLKLAAVYQIPALQQLKVGGSINWQDDISRDQGLVSEGPNAGTPIITRQEDYALVQLMTSYEFDAHVKASLNINNATDEKYINSLYWGQGYYGAPRHALVSVTWSL